jgi:hypothetical protein
MFSAINGLEGARKCLIPVNVSFLICLKSKWDIIWKLVQFILKVALFISTNIRFVGHKSHCGLMLKFLFQIEIYHESSDSLCQVRFGILYLSCQTNVERKIV